MPFESGPALSKLHWGYGSLEEFVKIQVVIWLVQDKAWDYIDEYWWLHSNRPYLSSKW